jgi:thioredoxin 1
MTTTVVTKDSFQTTVLDNPLTVMVDFWAPWCGPCRLLTPIVDDLASQYEGRLSVVKINVDEHPELASQYGIKSIPTLVFFQQGQVVERTVGVVPISTLQNIVNKYLAN